MSGPFSENHHRIRVLLACDYFWPVIGGAEISALTLFSRLSSMGARISVLAHRTPGTMSHETRNGMEIYRKSMIPRISWGIVQRIIFYILSSFHLARFVSKTKPDIIMTQQLIATPTTLISKLLKIPVIVIVRDYWPICYYRSLMKPNGQICSASDGCLKEMADCAENNFPPNIRRVSFLIPIFSLMMFTHSLFVNWIIKKASAIVAVSSFVKKKLTDSGYDSESIHVVYNPVQINPKVLSNSDKASSSVILFVGELVLKKGLQTVIEAMPSVIKEARNAKLIVVGEGSERRYFENLASSSDASAHVEFLGRVDNDNLVKLYEQCSLVVVPSLWPEPFGRVVAEALMHSRPVVASEVGGIPELVSPHTGILVPRGDKSALADAIVSMITEEKPPKFDASVTKKFSLETISMQYLSLIKSTRYYRKS